MMPDDQSSNSNEPRSAVEAAASEGHGGYQAGRNDAGQGGQYGNAFGRQNASDLMAQPAAFFNKASAGGPQTIMSAIGRLRKLAQSAQPLLHQGAQFVAALEGPRVSSAAQSDNGPGTSPQPQNPGTADQLHSAIADVETLIFGFGDLIARAKAVHG